MSTAATLVPSTAAPADATTTPCRVEVLAAGDIVTCEMAAWMTGLAANGPAMRALAADRLPPVTDPAGRTVDVGAFRTDVAVALPRYI